MESEKPDNISFVKVARPIASGGEGERWNHEQVSPTLNTFDLGDSRAAVLVARASPSSRPGNSARAQDPTGCGKVPPGAKGATAYGINVQSSNMFPFSRELSQVLSVTHLSGVVVYGIKANQSEKSRKPWSEGVAQCLSASCHDASVVMTWEKGANEE